MHPAQPVDMSATAAHQRPEFLLAGRGIKLRVKIIVASDEALEVSGLGELLLERDRVVEAYDQGFAVSCASSRTISSSSAWRRKWACSARPTSTRLTTVACCGNTSTSPSSSSRIKASRIGVELTPNCAARSVRDSGEPGGNSSARMALRSRSNTCGAACRARSSRAPGRGYAGRGFGWFHAKRSGQLAFDTLMH